MATTSRERDRSRIFCNEITGELRVQIYIYIYIYYTGINYVEQGIHEGNQTTPHNSLRNGETLLRMIMNDPSLFLLRSMSFALAEVKY